MTSDTFHHDPLSGSLTAFRLVRLLPRTHGGLIRCEILHADLAAQPDYEALSYVWGPPDLIQTIIVNGLPFTIRQNLWDYLDVVTSQTLPQDQPQMFIDQLCVNQADVKERNHQVHQMAGIYKSAKQVVCWLGPETPTSSQLMRSLSPLRDKLRPLCDLDIPNELEKMIDRHGWDTETDIVSDLIGPDHLWSLEDLFELEYWKRAWVVQEFVLAQDLLVRWGSETITFDALSLTAKLASEYSTDGAMDLLCEARMMHLGGKIVSWHYVTDILHGRHCEEPKDKVFAMLGLNSDSVLKPDYAKTCEQIFDEVAREFTVQAMEDEYASEDTMEEGLFCWAKYLNLLPDPDFSKYVDMWRVASRG